MFAFALKRGPGGCATLQGERCCIQTLSPLTLAKESAYRYVIRSVDALRRCKAGAGRFFGSALPLINIGSALPVASQLKAMGRIKHEIQTEQHLVSPTQLLKLNELTLGSLCDETEPSRRSSERAANARSKQKKSVSTRVENRSHECLFDIGTMSPLLMLAFPIQQQVQTWPNPCNCRIMLVHKMTHTNARNRPAQMHQNIIPTPRVGAPNPCQNLYSAKARDGKSQSQSQNTQIHTTHKTHGKLNTIIQLKPTVFSLLQNKSNRFGVSGRQINSLDGRGFESAISHFRQSTENCGIFFNIRIRDTDTETTDTNFPQQDPAPIIENAQIYYGNIWDATKGYRGEGPGPPAKKVPKKSQSTIINERHRKMRQGKKGENRARRTDNKWAGRLETWGDTTIQELGALMSTGDNLFTHPTHEGELEWHNLIGSIASLNVAGWSPEREMQRKIAWSQMADMRALAVSIVDHRRVKAQTNNVEIEVNAAWIGDTKEDDCKPLWVHAPAKTSLIGGVSLAVHPALRRYAHKQIHDGRGWSRWAGIELRGHEINGRTGHVIMIATYGPTPSDGDDSIDRVGIHTNPIL